MLLPQHKLTGFSYFTVDYKLERDKHYNTTCYDEITIYYSKQKSFLRYKYTKEFSESYLLTREATEDGWARTESTKKFIEQLTKYEMGNWNYVEPELYTRLVRKYPEEFL